MEEVTELENQVVDSVEEVEQPKEKLFTQDEVNAMMKKRLARAEKKSIPAPVQVTEKPKMKDGETVEDYTERLIDWKDSQKQAEKYRNSMELSQRELNDMAEKAYKKAEKIPEFDRDMFDSYLDDYEAELKDSPGLRALIESDQNAEIMAYMVTNPKEFEKLAELSPARQAAYIGKLETKLEKQTQANDPMTKVKGSAATLTGDPSKMKAGSAEWEEYRRKSGSSLYS